MESGIHQWYLPTHGIYHNVSFTIILLFNTNFLYGVVYYVFSFFDISIFQILDASPNIYISGIRVCDQGFKGLCWKFSYLVIINSNYWSFLIPFTHSGSNL